MEDYEMSETQTTDPVVVAMLEAGLIRNSEPALEVPEEIELAPEEETGVEAELSGIEGIEMVEPVTVAPVGAGEVSEDEIFAGLEDDLAAAAAREDVYAEQTSNVVIGATPEAPRRVTRTPSVGGGKREARFAPGQTGAYVASIIGDAEFQARVDALPKKVKEKAANLTDFLFKDRPLSVFTKAAVTILKEEGAITNERLVKAFTTEATKRGMSSGYSIGTARSQAGQQIALFGRLGIAQMHGGKLVPNGESAIWQKLVPSVIEPAVAA
jgi:hypothetical protein